MKSVGPSGVPSFTPAQALFFAHPAHPGCCALIGTDVPFYGARLHGSTPPATGETPALPYA
ncbi:MAG: hypothetical protein OXH52_18200, partial [Gammaproteobacteria bacterium]|nr:hypothetical protein [Gammaproteobacteria bacterium]